MSASQVIVTGKGGLWLGDLNDAIYWPSDRLCVLEQLPGYALRPGDMHVPILNTSEVYPASPKQLDLATSYIDIMLREGERRLLVHCGAGIERSPLTVAWYLRRFGGVKTLAEAYRALMLVRPVVADRTSWLPVEVRTP